MSWRRAAAAALLALQAVIALSPMLEQRETVRRDTHVEALGSHHLISHDDATCTVCAARTLMGTAPATPVAAFPAVARGQVDIAFAAVTPALGISPDNHSRAPPTLG